MMLARKRRISESTSLQKVSAAAALVLPLFTPVSAAAYDTSYKDPREMRMLPEYCKHTQLFRDRIPGGNNPDDIERWSTMMGPTFIHMHHYCYGLMATNKALYLSPEREDRLHNLGVSIIEFDYVIQRAPEGFGLLPEILTKKGENLILLDRGVEGVGILRRVIDLKQDYWRPYALIGDYYRDVGAPAKAREWLEKGLSAAPDTPALARRLAELKPAPRSKSTGDRQPSVQR
jgi:tetratricopeptide (TPR) repeat protein